MSAPRGAMVFVLGVVCTGALACRRGEAEEVAGQHAAAASTAHVADAHGTTHGARAPAEDSAAATLARREPGLLPTIGSEPVVGRSGPGEKPFEVALRTEGTRGGHSRRFGVRTLGIALRIRTPDLSQYPCSSCHAGKALLPSVDRVADAHENIQPVHPKETGAACKTCHAADEVETLKLESGERASLDHAYRLCAQCHFAQVEAWSHGAHGKRLDGWQGRRVVMGCADCHDPHAPATERRIPFRAPTFERPGSRER